MKGIVRRVRVLAGVIGVLVILSVAACNRAVGANAEDGAAPAGGATATPGPDGLTSFQLEHGIGPVTSPVTLATLDAQMASAGKQVFDEKCSACHKMAERYVGPALGEVLKRRTPAFVMNMALNPLGMVEKHPTTKKLLAEFFVAMPNQNLSPDQARQVVEYLRTQTP
jgi:cytochrome c